MRQNERRARAVGHPGGPDRALLGTYRCDPCGRIIVLRALAEQIGTVALLPAMFEISAALLIGVFTRAGARRRQAQFESGRARPPLRTAAALCGISVLLAIVGLLALLLA